MSEDSESLQQKVEAVFVTKFPYFVEWPERAGEESKDPFLICLFGDPAFTADVGAVARERLIRGRALEIRQVTDLASLRGCHVLFLGSAAQDRLDRVLADLAGADVLTVSAMQGFTDKGGMIGFFRHEGRVAFHINAEAARKAGLTISSHLLKLAEVIPGR